MTNQSSYETQNAKHRESIQRGIQWRGKGDRNMPEHLWPQPTFTSSQWTAIISSDTIIYFSSKRFLHILHSAIFLYMMSNVSGVFYLQLWYHVRYKFELMECIFTREYFRLFNHFFMVYCKVRCIIHCYLAIFILC